MPPSPQPTWDPKVSVRITTFNFEDFIQQAIESIFKQETNFDYEIIIGDDFSTDKTREIILGYQRKYPQAIRVLFYQKNMGARYNNHQLHRACRGEYVAVMDGDDYWTSPKKLQKQVDFLDAHPQCPMCFHNVHMYFIQTDRLRPYHQKEINPFLELPDLLHVNLIPTSSKMYRRMSLKEFPDWARPVPFGDWPMDIVMAQQGPIGYINEILGVYRIHKGGIWSLTKDNVFERQIHHAGADIRFFQAVNRYLNFKYNYIVDQEIAKRRAEIRECRIKKWKKLIVSLFPSLHRFFRSVKYRYIH